MDKPRRNYVRYLVTEREQNMLLCLCGILLLGFGLRLFAWEPSRQIQQDRDEQALRTELAAPESLQIDLRIASKEELMALPGIGEHRAAAILEYRAAHPFNSVNEIMNVSGIGPVTYENMKPMQLLFGNSEPLSEGRRTPRSRSSASTAAAVSHSSRIDLNHASLEELCSLSGIGETRARAILAYRAEHGAFRSIEEIMDVQGIGPGIFERNRHRLIVNIEQ